MKKPQIVALLVTLTFVCSGFYFLFGEEISSLSKPESKSPPEVIYKEDRPPGTRAGTIVDSYNGVEIFDNGRVGNVSGRNVTADGYNLGLKYQCVEFVKRFYYEYFNHKMPNSYGHAKDFYDASVLDGGYSKKRALYQYKNGGITKPKKNDIIVFGPTPYNKFGHVAIISKVSHSKIEIAQQNPGTGVPSRVSYDLLKEGDNYYVDEEYAKCWLRK